jgi:hypothetical protein
MLDSALPRNHIEMKHELLRDADIRAVLSRTLRSQHEFSANTLILEEFGCNDARADLAVINEEMHCFEIKSGCDKLDRLDNQVPAYSAVFDQVTLVTESNHTQKAKATVPRWWGIIEVRRHENALVLHTVRKGRKNRKRRKRELSTLLWRNEAYSLLRSHERHVGLRDAPVRKLWQAVESLPLETLADAVRSAIMQRGGSGFRQPLLQNGGSFPTASKTQDFRVTTALLL